MLKVFRRLRNISRRSAIIICITVVVLVLILKSCIDYYGPCTGVVLDAQTGKPIAGAQVMVKLFHSNFLDQTAEVYKFGQTDENGKYRIPGTTFSAHAKFELVAYKAGYVVYSSWRRFEDAKEVKDFKFRNHKILLEKWDDKNFTAKDRVHHVDRIKCGPIDFGIGKPEEHKAYCREAREEMILACMENPLPRELCIEIVDEPLGLTKEGNNNE